MVDKLMPLVARFKFLIQRIYYPSIDRVGNITAPFCVIRGLRDEIVPCEHSKTLYEAASKAQFKVMYEFPDGDHNSTYKTGGETYIKNLKSFFERCEK
jgi:dipeptidyl aminopeptidase/acylaminoacyl peptidase